MTDTVSHIVASRSLSGNFNCIASQLVTKYNHRKIINTAGGGQGGGVRLNRKIFYIFSEVSTCNKR